MFAKFKHRKNNFQNYILKFKIKILDLCFYEWYLIWMSKLFSYNHLNSTKQIFFKHFCSWHTTLDNEAFDFEVAPSGAEIYFRVEYFDQTEKYLNNHQQHYHGHHYNVDGQKSAHTPQSHLPNRIVWHVSAHRWRIDDDYTYIAWGRWWGCNILWANAWHR